MKLTSPAFSDGGRIPDATLARFRQALEGHVLAKATLTGTYGP